MAWDPDADALACAHCETSVAVPRATGGIVEYELAHAGAAARGYSDDARKGRCKSCGAEVVFAGTRTSERCVFCGSPQVLEQEANRNLIRPESLIPLDVARPTVEREFRAWLKRLWFRPSALMRTRSFQASGVYVPCWTFDAHVHSDWSADAGHTYWTTETYVSVENGRPVVRTRPVQRIRWVPAWGQRDDVFDDVLVSASRAVSSTLFAKLGAFDLKGLVPYRAEYLAGWQAEEYALDLTGGWAAAQTTIERTQEGRCAGDVPGDTHRFLRVANKISGVRWKHVLVPVWSLTYVWNAKSYSVLIHGQSGRVVGDAPLSFAKIAGAVLGVLALVLVGLALVALFS